MIVTLHSDDMVEVSDEHDSIYACTQEDSDDFLRWFVGTTDRSVFKNRMVFNNEGQLVTLVKEWLILLMMEDVKTVLISHIIMMVFVI